MTLQPIEMSGIDLIRQQMARLGFPINDESPEAVAAAAVRLAKWRKLQRESKEEVASINGDSSAVS